MTTDQDLKNSIPDSELLARYVTFKRWIRADSSIHQDAFIPPSTLELSVTRHVHLDEAAIWDRGFAVAHNERDLFLGVPM